MADRLKTIREREERKKRGTTKEGEKAVIDKISEDITFSSSSILVLKDAETTRFVSHRTVSREVACILESKEMKGKRKKTRKEVAKQWEKKKNRQASMKRRD